MSIPMLISTLLLTTCGAAVAISLYAIQKNLRPLINRLFLAIGWAAVLWAFGLAVNVSAKTPQASAIGRFIMAPGWGFTACMALHIILLLTGKTAFLKHWWAYILIYSPGAATTLGFSILPLFGVNVDELARTTLGWVRVSPVDGWDLFYFTHTFVFIAISIALLLQWERRSHQPHVRKQARLMSGSFILAAILGTATDILPSLLRVPFPQMSAIFMMFLIATTGYSIKRYDLLGQNAVDPGEMILNKAARTHVCQYMSFTAYAISAAMILFKQILFFDKAWPPILLFSAFWALSGVVHIVINRMNIDDTGKEMLEAVHFSLLIPLVSLFFSELGVLTMWAIVFPMVIFSLLFNQHIMFTTIIVSAFLTQLLTWFYMPEASMRTFAPIYLLRIAVIFFTAAISMYVHRIFTRRLKENAAHVDMQSIASEISHDFINAGEQNLYEKLYDALERCAQYIQCDRGYVMLLEEGTAAVRHSLEWLVPAMPSQLATFEEWFQSIRAALLERLKAEKAIVINDTAQLSAASGPLKKRLEDQGIRAMVIFAIFKKDEVIGMLGFNASRPLRQWNLEDTTFLQIISGILADAIIKVDGEREINFIAYHDQLTRLPNRNLFQDRLQQAIGLADRTEKMLGVVFVDLDSFKTVNDTMGHDLGDSMLIKMAQTLTRSVRAYDTVARFGGDEFIILLKQLSGPQDIDPVMDHIMAAMQKPVILNGQEFFITASAGVALYPLDGDDPETLIKNADTAMYAAKSAGKNRYALCSQDMKDDIMEKMRLTNLLYRAQERGQFILHYQPQVDTESHAIVGFEALARWLLPERGLVSPAVFIPLAEQTGLIQGIGEWVLRTACEQNKRWQAMGFPKLRIAVNVSVHQLKNPRFVELVAEVLRQTGLSAEFLELEITESVTNDNTDNIVEILNRLKALGVTIAIDDFGTEYSSLSRLKLLPVDRIKMDMQFVQGIERSEKDQAISKVIINLAKSLNLKVIAEGVETAPQLDFLGRRMCDEVQGFYFYKPMPADEAEVILKRGR